MKICRNLMAVITLLFVLIGCKKNVPDNNAKTLLYEQKIADIKLNEPLSLTFGDDDVYTKVVWNISPNANTTIATIANNATIEFANAGIYTITATTENVYATYLITVGNRAYEPNYGTNFNLVANKLVKIKVNEMVLFKVYNPLFGNTINWSATTLNGGYTITRDNVNKTATFIFTKSGLATITASDGINEQRRTIWIEDSSNTNPNTIISNFMLGDKLQITPSIEQPGGVKKLVFTANTTRKYNCSADIILGFNNNFEYQIDYAGVNISPTTCSKRGVATCVNSFKNIKVGTYPFAINFANKTYSGTLTLDVLGKYTIGWNNGNDVSIYPLSL